MDPVSRILVELEGRWPRLGPWVILAVLFHGSIAAAIFFLGRTASARPAHLPAVSVKIIRPEEPRSRARRSRPRPTPVTRPTAAPTAVPEALPTAAVKASEEAMAAPQSSYTPVERSEPEPEAGPTGRGLSLGEGGAQQMPGIPADFHFSYYVERMLALIESRWYKPAAPSGTMALVRFRIHRDGKVDRIELERISGNSSFDRAALRALYAANPLPPLPPGYGKNTLTVHLTFAE